MESCPSKTKTMNLYAALLRFGKATTRCNSDGSVDAHGCGVIARVFSSKEEAAGFLVGGVYSYTSHSILKEAVHRLCAKSVNPENFIALLEQISILLQYYGWDVRADICEFSAPLGGEEKKSSGCGMLLLHKRLAPGARVPEASIVGVYSVSESDFASRRIPDHVSAAEFSLQAKLVQGVYRLESHLKDRVVGVEEDHEGPELKSMYLSPSLSAANKMISENPDVSNRDILESLKDSLTFGDGSYSWASCHVFKV